VEVDVKLNSKEYPVSIITMLVTSWTVALPRKMEVAKSLTTAIVGPTILFLAEIVQVTSSSARTEFV
jgi:hypothetical protein